MSHILVLMSPHALIIFIIGNFHLSTFSSLPTDMSSSARMVKIAEFNGKSLIKIPTNGFLLKKRIDLEIWFLSTTSNGESLRENLSPAANLSLSNFLSSAQVSSRCCLTTTANISSASWWRTAAYRSFAAQATVLSWWSRERPSRWTNGTRWKWRKAASLCLSQLTATQDLESGLWVEDAEFVFQSFCTLILACFAFSRFLTSSSHWRKRTGDA